MLLNPRLREYQVAGAKRLRSLRRAVLADEPGLGKSAQALAAAELPVLIVAPGHAHGVWQDEIATWLAPTLKVGMYSGVGRRRRVPDFAEFDIVIANYASLVEVLPGPWATVIFDEAHTLRNRHARTLFKSVRSRLSKRSRVYLLTGSPIFEHAGDLWPLLHIVDRKKWPSYWAFVGKYAFVDRNDFGWEVEGTKNVVELRSEVADVVIQRTYELVKRELPALLRRKYRVTMSPLQATAYQELEHDMMTELADGRLLTAPSQLAVTTRLRQLLVTPQLLGIDDEGAALTALSAELAGAPRPVVIFTPFTEAMPFIHDAIADAGYGLIEHLKGGMKPSVATEAWRTFQHSTERDRAIIAQIGLGTGWSANSSHEAFFLGMAWSAPVHDQAERRLRRDGQRNPVLARYFIHSGTLEEAQLELLAGKKTIADVIMGLRKKR